MRVLIADAFPTTGLEALAAAGCEVGHRPELQGESLTEALTTGRPEVLVVRGTRVTADHLAAPGLSLVIRAGSGCDTIDVDAARAQGVAVANCPGQNAVAVAELAFGLILALDRRIPDAVADLRGGRWDKTSYAHARGLSGRRLGILGLGHIGRVLVTRALAFGMPVVAWSRSLTPGTAAELGVERADSPRQVAATCDVLSIHLALTDETRGLVDADLLRALPDGGLLVNTARAAIVDQAALRAELDAGRLWAGLDVWADEPSGGTGVAEDPLMGHPHVYGTHHVGASTEQAQEAIAAECVRIVEEFARSRQVLHAVTPLAA